MTGILYQRDSRNLSLICLGNILHKSFAQILPFCVASRRLCHNESPLLQKDVCAKKGPKVHGELDNALLPLLINTIRL